MSHSARAARRAPATLIVGAAVAGLIAATLAAPAATATPTRHVPTPVAGAAGGDNVRMTLESRARRALSQAEAAFSPATDPTQRPDATMALRRLVLLKDKLSPGDRAAADKLLSRPIKPQAMQSGNIRLHYNSAEFNPLAFDENDALNTMVSVSQAFSGAGYGKPLPDGSRGGNSKTDVYIDTLQPGLYGYCTTDDPSLPPSGPGKANTWAFCVLDNDYAGFPNNTPLENLQVTAAHEYFHAVQFRYDFHEDPWFMEATAAWGEDELYDGVNDNVQYLQSSPISDPKTSMDKFGGIFHYGVWIFFRYLTEKFPKKKGQMPRLVLDMWKAADSSKGAKSNRSSVEAINKVLSNHKFPLDKAFSLFSDANRRTHRVYDEGSANSYPVKRLAGKKTLKNKGQSKLFRSKLNHLTSSTYRFGSQTLNNSKFKLRLKLDLADKVRGSRAVVSTWKDSGKVKTKVVKLNGKGNKVLTVGFSSQSVDYVEVTIVNASTRYKNCYANPTPYACSGQPRDQHVHGKVRGTVIKKN